MSINFKLMKTLALGSAVIIGPWASMEAMAVDSDPATLDAMESLMDGVATVTTLEEEKCVIPSNTQRRGLYLETNPTLRIGEVTVNKIYDNIEVYYQILEPGWCLDATQVHINPTDPNDPGDPGTFPDSHSSLSDGSQCTRFDYYKIPLGEVPPCISCVATHANMTKLRLPLDGQAGRFMVFGNKAKIPSYFNAAFEESSCSDIGNPYHAWCVDFQHTISRGVWYEGCSLYSSLNDQDPKLATIIDKPQNLDLVNWVVNHKYDYIDPADNIADNNIQAAIWRLIDDKDLSGSSSGGGISWDLDLVNQIVEDAYDNGEYFSPNENQIVGLIVECYDAESERRQTIFVEVGFSELEMSSYDAWGRGDPYCPISSDRVSDRANVIKIPRSSLNDKR